jgi:NAD(P)-dependent dehydrogenase (short-subunit alcohol dehydrogenase family)
VEEARAAAFSIAGLAGSAGQAAYGAAKAGLASLARSVTVEYRRHAFA